MNAPSAPAELANIGALIASGRLAEADRACEAILARHPGDSRARYFRAQLRFRAGRSDEALAQIEALLRDDPRMAPARYLLGDVHRVAGRFAAAAQAYGDALAADFALPPAASLSARLEAIVDYLVRGPLRLVDSRFEALAAVGHMLEQAGATLDEACLARLAASPLALARDAFEPRLHAAGAVLGASMRASPAWTRPIAERVLVPWMRRALEAGLHDQGLAIETFLYFTYVRQKETQEHFRDCVLLYLDDMRAAGRRFAAALPPVAPRRAEGLPRVAFFVHNVTALAHVTALLEVLEGHAELAEPKVEPHLFYVEGKDAVLERFRRAGVRVESLEAVLRARGLAQALAHLRARIAELGIGTLAWISLVLQMPFAFSMRVAPRQVWWAMKYYTLGFPEIDDYLTGGGESGFKEIYGREWRVGPVVAGQWVAPERAAEARRIREDLGSPPLVYGCFAREQKMSAPFVDAVVAILHARPEAMFLWTGREQASAVQKRLEAGGVAARCRFIGWVDTKLYAQAIDVFLDSFPFPCGFTIYEAMAAGKAVVLYASPETEHGGINAIVAPLLAADPGTSEQARHARGIFLPAGGERLYLRARGDEDYVRTAVALAEDPGLRERAGRANREFIERVMSDRKRAALVYIDHLLGVPPRGQTP
ncbi:MAG TPA: tetratricopeptide repeat protein [Usitatibacter sp.]|nr:tetratricopeptide repeat protein [Usitatibacter sp.]